MYVCTNIHTYIHTYINTFAECCEFYVHTYVVRTYIWTYMHTYVMSRMFREEYWHTVQKCELLQKRNKEFEEEFSTVKTEYQESQGAYLCMYVHAYVNMHLCVCTYVCTYVYIIHIYTNMHHIYSHLSFIALYVRTCSAYIRYGVCAECVHIRTLIISHSHYVLLIIAQPKLCFQK